MTHQLDDLDENPVIGGGRHELEEERGQRQVVLGISASQLTDDVHCRRLDTCRTVHTFGGGVGVGALCSNGAV